MEKMAIVLIAGWDLIRGRGTPKETSGLGQNLVQQPHILPPLPLELLQRKRAQTLSGSFLRSANAGRDLPLPFRELFFPAQASCLSS